MVALDYSRAREVSVEFIVPGDIVDTRCGIGEYAWSRVTKVRSSTKDEIELTLENVMGANGMCSSRVSRWGHTYRVIPAP